MADFTVVGASQSAVHFALSALECGSSVELIDIGSEGQGAAPREDSLADLREMQEDPAEYFFGRNFEGIRLPPEPGPAGLRSRKPEARHISLPGNAFGAPKPAPSDPLCEPWNRGYYPLHADELEDFPIAYSDLEACYEEVANRIGISGAEDQLSTSIPVHSGLLPPVRLDSHSAALLSLYGGKKRTFEKRLACRIGRARLAVLSQDLGRRKACSGLARCRWSCPRNALYRPRITLRECLRNPNFCYIGGHFARFFRYDESHCIEKLVIESLDSRECREIKVNKLVLAAGTLQTSRIFLESIYRASGELVRLSGLMTTPRMVFPYLNLLMIGKTLEGSDYSGHQLAMALDSANRKHAIHCLISPFKTAPIHSIVGGLALDLRAALFFYRNLHPALGLVEVNFSSIRHAGNALTLDLAGNPDYPGLAIYHEEIEPAPGFFDAGVKRVKNALLRLGCLTLPGTRWRDPITENGEFAGTLPMCADASVQWSTDPRGRSNDFTNLYLADASSFPFLPAKDPGFTLMANACRVAEHAVTHLRSS